MFKNFLVILGWCFYIYKYYLVHQKHFWWPFWGWLKQVQMRSEIDNYEYTFSWKIPLPTLCPLARSQQYDQKVKILSALIADAIKCSQRHDYYMFSNGIDKQSNCSCFQLSSLWTYGPVICCVPLHLKAYFITPFHLSCNPT